MYKKTEQKKQAFICIKVKSNDDPMMIKFLLVSTLNYVFIFKDFKWTVCVSLNLPFKNV